MALRRNFTHRTAEPNKIPQRQKDIPGEYACIAESIRDGTENRHSGGWRLSQA